MSWESKLPKSKSVPKKMIEGIMVRPSIEVCEWLASQADKYHVSVNKIVLAIIEDAKEKRK